MAVVRRLQCCSDAFLPQGLSEWFQQASADCVSLDPGDDLRGKNVSEAGQVKLIALLSKRGDPGPYLPQGCFAQIDDIPCLDSGIIRRLDEQRILHDFLVTGWHHICNSRLDRHTHNLAQRVLLLVTQQTSESVQARGADLVCAPANNCCSERIHEFSASRLPSSMRVRLPISADHVEWPDRLSHRRTHFPSMASVTTCYVMAYIPHGATRPSWSLQARWLPGSRRGCGLADGHA